MSKEISTASRVYWENRHQKTDLSTVGYIGLGLPFNYWMYRIRKYLFLKTVRPYQKDIGKKNILDIGSGSGFYIPLWQSLKGKNITASDLSSKALKKIRKQFPKIKTLELDITKKISKNLQNKFQIVSAFDIFYHIMDEKGYAQAINNAGLLLTDKGYFFFSENLLENETVSDKHQISRQKKITLALLKKNGFKIKTIKPVFYLMNTPIDSQNWLLKAHWFLLNNLLIRFNFLGYLLGPLLYPIELVLINVARNQPSTKIIVCQKTNEARV